MEYHPRAAGVLSVFLGGDQETFLRLFKRMRRSSDPILNPTGWLFTVARNQVKVAAKKHRPQVADGDPAEHLDNGAARWASVAPQATAEQRFAARAAIGYMTDLPKQQRIATYLIRVQGWSLAEIGEYLACAESTAGVHAHRGTNKLRDLTPRVLLCRIAPPRVLAANRVHDSPRPRVPSGRSRSNNYRTASMGRRHRNPVQVATMPFILRLLLAVCWLYGLSLAFDLTLSPLWLVIGAVAAYVGAYIEAWLNWRTKRGNQGL